MASASYTRLFILVFWIALHGCADSNESCEKACEKRVSLADQEAKDTLTWWHQLPDDFREDAQKTETQWRKNFVKEKARFLDACTKTCNDGARASVIECRRRALSTSEWIRCAEK